MSTTGIFIDAPSPFDDPSADIIVRSAERVDFRMHKLLLSLASPFFKEMFEVPQPPTIDGGEAQGSPDPDDTRDGIPVIFMYDDQNQICGKAVVEFILSSCHPKCLQSSRASPASDIIGTVVDVGTRYGMDYAVKTVLRDPHLLVTNPFVLFVCACQHKLAEEATLAAKEILRFRIEKFPREPAWKVISAYQYHTLLEFHRRCGKATAALAQSDNADWIPEHTLRLFPDQHVPCSSSYRDSNSTLGCWNMTVGFSRDFGDIWGMKPTTNFPNSSIQQWWIDYMGSISRALDSKPHSSTVDEPERVDDATGAACPTCAVQARVLMRNFVPIFKQQVEKVIDEICESPEFAFT
ncbi:hypothetical protein C8F04DRAFT_729023 [Mycena alexandri]|uniref:BTB domain-containing protein n=1 Tax=Mycena alexandri TaxID=1745969 RepID=A0AAD6TEA2_9AGAR|nr:hypothetical protein C8F04DRAFT_729023 [Mycena alexandri]